MGWGRVATGLQECSEKKCVVICYSCYLLCIKICSIYSEFVFVVCNLLCI